MGGRSANVKDHYSAVRNLLEKESKGQSQISGDYASGALAGLDAWIAAANQDLLRFGYLVFVLKPY